MLHQLHKGYVWACRLKTLRQQKAFHSTECSLFAKGRYRHAHMRRKSSLTNSMVHYHAHTEMKRLCSGWSWYSKDGRHSLWSIIRVTQCFIWLDNLLWNISHFSSTLMKLIMLQQAMYCPKSITLQSGNILPVIGPHALNLTARQERNVWIL